MNQEAALLAAILDDPDSDLPRLIYADWCEEQGSPRAEFIRLQCELDRTSVHRDKSALRAFARKCRRSQELLTQHGTTWLAPLERVFGPTKFHAFFRRGFVETVYAFDPARRDSALGVGDLSTLGN